MMERANARTALVAAGCALSCAVMLAVGILVVSTIRDGQERMVRQLEQQPLQIATIAVDYTDLDGRSQHVEVSGPADGPPNVLLGRLRARLDEMEREFPRRR